MGIDYSSKLLNPVYSTVPARRLLFVWCTLSDDCQTIIRCLSCQMPTRLPPDICQTTTTYTPDIYHMSTRHICQTYTRLVGIWYMSGVYVILVWHLSDGTSDRHLTIILQTSDREHQTNSKCLAGMVVYFRKCTLAYSGNRIIQSFLPGCCQVCRSRWPLDGTLPGWHTWLTIYSWEK